jgi:hypothetical protein
VNDISFVATIRHLKRLSNIKMESGSLSNLFAPLSSQFIGVENGNTGGLVDHDPVGNFTTK